MAQSDIIELPSGELTVEANQEKYLPSLTNESAQAIVLKISAQGAWNYGSEWKFADLVDANGNLADTGRQPYLLYPNITPAALVAFKNDQKTTAVASGKEQTIELQPDDKVSFINNDQEGVYHDNSGTQVIKWSIAGVKSSYGISGGSYDDDVSIPIKLPTGKLTVDAREEKDPPSLTNKSGKTVTVKIVTEGQWNYGVKDAFAHQVSGDGNTADTGRKQYMRFKNALPSALVSVKDVNSDQALASGSLQTVTLLPGETLYFFNNDQCGAYHDNSGTLIVHWSISGIS